MFEDANILWALRSCSRNSDLVVARSEPTSTTQANKKHGSLQSDTQATWNRRAELAALAVTDALPELAQPIDKWDHEKVARFFEFGRLPDAAERVRKMPWLTGESLVKSTPDSLRMQFGAVPVNGAPCSPPCHETGRVVLAVTGTLQDGFSMRRNLDHTDAVTGEKVDAVFIGWALCRGLRSYFDVKEPERGSKSNPYRHRRRHA